MSDEYSHESSSGDSSGFGRLLLQFDAFVPVTLLCVSLIVLLAWQVSNSSTQHTLLESAIARQENSSAQSNQVQASLAKLASDLLHAAQTDDTAKAIAEKYGIKVNGPATPEPPAPGK